ncbi:hypothetical protein ACNOYE_37745 [Nannocystaceae bacterium ST9]
MLRRLSPLLLATLVLAGCSTTRVLVAGDGSHRLLARDAGTGVTMILTTEVWDGDPMYGDDLTIVHVLIANMGSEPVLLAPGDFELRDRQGFDYVLYDAGGSFSALPEGADPRAVAEQQQPYAYDPGRSVDYDNIETDDGELSRLALPWGVLLPGTQMRGFLYFDDVRDASNHATLIWHAETPDHRRLADFGFDLHVAVLDRDRAGTI